MVPARCIQQRPFLAQQGVNEVGKEIRLVAPPLHGRREDALHGAPLDGAGPPVAEFLVGRQREAELHKADVEERKTRFDPERSGCPRRHLEREGSRPDASCRN